MTAVTGLLEPKEIKALRKSGKRTNVLFFASMAVLGVIVLAAVFAPLVAPYDPDALDLFNVLSGPSAAHWLGTDASGRDTLSRLIFGARTSMLGPLIVVIGSTVLGIVLGLASGWLGGVVDAVLSRIFDLIFAFPSLLLAMLAVTLFGKGLIAPAAAMTIAYTPYVARQVRQLVAAEKAKPYVTAYGVQGFSTPWVAFGRVLPNIVPSVGAQSALNFGYVLSELAALSFLGLGVQPPLSDWGSMINESAAGLMSGQFLPAIVPSVAVVIVVVAVNIFGEELSDRIGGKLPS
jgi:ABC-type dipeptide/oligopeptide/nickel transport system permease subunit